jgi:hypothetical protein
VLKTEDLIMEYVGQYPVETAAIIQRLRQVVKASVPGVEEIIYHGALGYSPTGAPYDRIIYIWPAKQHVTLGFFFGTHLKDPRKLLEGEGARMRHVKVRTMTEADNSALKRLVVAAGADGPDSLAKLHKKWQRVNSRKRRS